MPPAHLVAVGDALADLVVAVGHGVCERLGVAPGAAAFVSLPALDEAAAALAAGASGPPSVSAGGSAANTCVTFAGGGGRGTLVAASMGDALSRDR